MKENIVQVKSYAFALRIIKLYQHLNTEHKGYIIATQVLRSGTSIGANVEEAIGAQSTKDFLAKLSIAYKEARETKYWLCLLRDSGYISSYGADSLLVDVEELCKIIGSIQKTTKHNNAK